MILGRIQIVLQVRVRAEALMSRRGRGLIPPFLRKTRDLVVIFAIASRGLRTGRSIQSVIVAAAATWGIANPVLVISMVALTA